MAIINSEELPVTKNGHDINEAQGTANKAVASIENLGDELSLKVSKGEVVSEINLSEEGVRIKGDKIGLDGDVTVSEGFKLKADVFEGETFRGNSFIKAIDLKNEAGHNVTGESSIDDEGIIITQKTKDPVSGANLSETRSILNNGINIGTPLDYSNGDKSIDYKKEYSQLGKFGLVTPNIARTSDRATPYWNGKGGGDFSTEGALKANGITPSATHFYIGVPGEVRIVDEKGNTTAGLTYKPIRASAFTVASSRDYKKNIEEYTGDALELVNGTRVTQYNLNDEDENVDYKRIGLIVQESPLEIINFDGGDSIDLYEMTSLLWKSVQELDAKNKVLEKEKNNLDERLSKIESLLNLD